MAIAATLVSFFGLCVGSFLNVLADRGSRGESVLWGRSHCDHCKKVLRWFELIPVLSFVLQGGRCLRCHKPLSIQYPLVELATSLGFLYLYSSHSPLPLYVLFSSFLVIFVSDLKEQIIPDSMIVVGLFATLAMGIHILPALGSFAFLYILWAATRGRGMGFGDVKLAFLMGLLLGFPAVVVAFYIAFLTGAFVGVILMLVGKKGWKSKIAFGPFLVLGTAVAYLWGHDILTWWNRFV